MFFLNWNLARPSLIERISSKAFFVVRFGLGNLLLSAAALKALAILNEATDLREAALQVALVVGETMLGLWLVSGVRSSVAWQAAVAAFGLFAAYSLLQAIRGSLSCNCFGRVDVSPWISFAIDLMAVVALIWWRPAAQRHQARGSTRVAAGALAAVLASLPVTILVSWLLLSSSQALHQEKAPIVLVPQSWIGKLFPLITDVDAGNSLKHGRWHLIVYHHDCSECMELLRRYEDGLTSKLREGEQVMLIELPPYGALPKLKRAQFTHAKLADRADWFVKAPVEIDLDEGMVVGVSP